MDPQFVDQAGVAGRSGPTPYLEIITDKDYVKD
jgi:hypothetical protein